MSLGWLVAEKDAYAGYRPQCKLEPLLSISKARCRKKLKELPTKRFFHPSLKSSLTMAPAVKGPTIPAVTFMKFMAAKATN